MYFSLDSHTQTRTISGYHTANNFYELQKDTVISILTTETE